MNNLRFSILTLNLWNTERWEARQPALQFFLQTYVPDICCFQELRSTTARCIDNYLSEHERVNDSEAGWMEEGNIYWNRLLFSEIGHGAVELDMPEQDRRLFWVTLRENESGKRLFISTVHLTHQGNADELATGYSYRHQEAKIMAAQLPGLISGDDAAVVCGDFNDPIHPARILTGIGFRDIFYELGQASPVTFPSQPATEEIWMTEAIDRIMAYGCLRPINAAVPRFYSNGITVSDHWPVIAVYELM